MPEAADSTLDAAVTRLYAEMGVRPVINAAGAYTMLGGSQLSPGVRAAMETANLYFADMRSLMESSGRVIADMLGVEAAFITSGAAAALALSVAACMTLNHRDYLERLPDSDGIPNEVVVQGSTRQKYDRLLGVSGGRIVDAGDEKGLTMAQLEAAIGPKTVAVHYFVPLQGPVAGVPALEDVVEVAHRHGLPVIADAAGHTYPLDHFRRYVRAGADLVCYAAKYFDAPHSTGMVIGRKDLVEMVALNSFIGFETSGYLTIGRPMKVDRQEIVAVVAALREWLAMDHEARYQTYAERIDVILAGLKAVPGLEARRISALEQPTPVVRDGVRVALASPVAAEAIAQRLRDGEPSIWTRANASAVDVSVAYMSDTDVTTVARRLAEELSTRD